MMLTDAEIEALLLSLRVAGWSLLVSLPLAVCVAFLLARTNFPGKSLVNALIYLPLVLPPVITGYALLLVFGRSGLVGEFLYENLGIVFAFRWTGAVIAASIMAFPLMVRPLRLSFEAVDRNLEQAAATLGASRLRIFATITLPLALPGFVAGAMLGFAKCLGEFGATITFVSNIPGETRTLSMAVYTLLQVPGREDAVLRLAVIAIVVSVVAVILSELITHRMSRKLEGRHA
jgi:molybdate transport system permease protein